MPDVRPSAESTTINYLPQIARQVTAAGGDAAAWLRRGGLSEAGLADPGTVVPIERYSALVCDALRITGDSALGLALGRALTPGTHGVVGLAAAASGSVGEALRIAETYFALRTSLVRLGIDDRPAVGHVRVTFDPSPSLGDATGVVLEAAMLTVKNFVDSLVLQEGICEEVAFAHEAPPHAPLVRDFFRTRIAYGRDWSGLSLNRRMTARPLGTRDGLVLAEAIAICRRELERTADATTTALRLERMMLEIEAGFPSLDAAARLMKMSPKTLHRRLAAEGTSYRGVLESVRSRLALEYLQTRRISVQETAFLLGYSDSANFRRAFKRWHGVPPGRFDRD
ncbi:AraC family transcriptional regulator [Hasllibacter halocynthiae]|uniref:AraC family transcriptional regulator n=1 Tax=Hasllibacter halocynthiae TaxID=595589 RepID=A0A2T0WZN5_9RHOB|nr:AraC family transcriptional regulator [Hasllibacter halocynthiae]PRY92054.1 AraC family transcriptional regulator [Hasllibacter halocynthiae]